LSEAANAKEAAISILLAILWIIAVFGISYYVVRRFAQTSRLVAGCVAVGVLAAFLIGSFTHPTESVFPRDTPAATGNGIRLPKDPKLDRLSFLGDTNLSSIDLFGYAPTQSEPAHPLPGMLFPLDGDLVITGWAVDPGRQIPASGIFVIIDGNHRSSGIDNSYGAVRLDVAAALKNPKLTKVGYSVAVPLEQLSPGKHWMQLGVESADGKGFYRFEGVMEFSVGGAQ
jgi:hypothetical protein